MRILIMNFGTKLNLGSYALLEGTIAMLLRAFPGADIGIVTLGTERSFDGYAMVRSPIAPSSGMKSKLSSLWSLLVILFMIVCWKCRLVQGAFRRRFPEEFDFAGSCRASDVVVNTGGDILTEDYGRYSLMLSIGHLALGRLAGAKLVLVGESIGPFRSRVNRVVARRLIASTHAILARESLTDNYVRRMGVRGQRVYRIPDPSLAIKAREPVDSMSMVASARADRSTVCLAPSALAWKYLRPSRGGGHDLYQEYVGMLADIVRVFVDEIGTDVVLLAHVTGPSEVDDDRAVCSAIKAKFQDRAEVRVLQGVQTPLSVREFIQGCSFMVAMRMHAAIAGYATRVPTLSIGYSPKFEGMAMDTMGSSAWFVNLREESLDDALSNRTIARIWDCWNMRAEVRAKLNARAREVDREIDQAVTLLRSLLSE